jgi:hypothetical protein
VNEGMALKSCKDRFERETLKALWRLAAAFEEIAEYLQERKAAGKEPGNG